MASMPTGSKLVAALAFGGLAWFASELIKPLLVDGAAPARFAQINGLLGVMAGWLVMGPRTGNGNISSIGIGLTTAATMTIWGLFLHSLIQMIKTSTRPGSFNGAFDAIVSVFEKALEYAQVIATPEVLGTLAVGGILGGLISEWASRRWL